MPLKDFLYNPLHLKESEDDKKRYLKTHNISDPGYQKDREYNWPVDKKSFVFGKSQKLEFEGTEKSIKSDLSEALYPKTKIVEKRYNDFSQASNDIIGKSKFKGTLHSSIDNDFVFGKVKKKKEDIISNTGK